MTEFRPGRFQILPTVVKNLVIINTLILFAQFVLAKMGIDIADYLGLHYWKSSHYHFWQFFTHMFVHGNLTHLISNMFALWMFGSVLENVWGPKRFILFYLVCGMGAAMLHMGVVAYEFNLFQNAFTAYQHNATLDQYNLFIHQNNMDHIGVFDMLRARWEMNPSSIAESNQSISLINQYMVITQDEATVGASGAVFGILFAFGYLFPNTLLYLYFLVPIKAKYVVAAYALFEIYAGVQNSAGDNVAHYAHLGGMLVAFILLKFWNKTNRNEFF